MTVTLNSEVNWEEDSKRFDAVADLYDLYRPDYPRELIDSVIALTNIPPGGKILEIGSGTGKATASFARRGYSILCIEPGKNLAAVAARNLKNFPRVAFEIIRFEDWELEPVEFDVAISAQAFHWVPKEVGYAKVARTLKPHGCVALFWNMDLDPNGELSEDLNKVYREIAPQLADRGESRENKIKQREDEINANGHFGKVEVKRFPWSARYNTKQYLGLLNTHSDHLRLSEPTRQRLFDRIAEVINKDGGYIEKLYQAVLYVAPKVN